MPESTVTTPSYTTPWDTIAQRRQLAEPGLLHIALRRVATLTMFTTRMKL